MLCETSEKSSERRVLAVEVLTIWLPAFLGFSLTAAVLYLSITRQPIDPLLSHLLTTIVGYFFAHHRPPFTASTHVTWGECKPAYPVCCPQALQSHPHDVSSRSAVKPIARRFGLGGCVSSRIADRTALIAWS